MQARTNADRRIAVVREIAESIEGSDERTQAKQKLLGTLIGSLDRLDDLQKADLPPTAQRRSARRRGGPRASAEASTETNRRGRAEQERLVTQLVTQTEKGPYPITGYGPSPGRGDRI